MHAGDLFAIQERAVGRALVFDEDFAAVVDFDQQVLARDFGIVFKFAKA